MKRTNFFSIKNQECVEGIYHFQLQLLPDCPVYQGHFPGTPIAPGVCNIEMIKACAEEVLDQELFMGNLSLCRMTALLTPQENPEVELTLQITPADDAADITASSAWKIQAQLFTQEQSFIELKGDFSPLN